MKLKGTLMVVIFTMTFTLALSQEVSKTNPTSYQKSNNKIEWRHSIGSTFFLVGNLDTKEPPAFFQLNYGYYLTPKDVIVIEAITWNYYGPLGISYGSSGESYPGKIKGFGIGAGYQRFHWRNMYTTVQATPFLQNFLNEDNEKIQNGFQLFLQLRLGYRFEFFNDRFFIEPSLVCNYWPVNTNFPEDFDEIEKEWPNYFLFEPGLHFGFKF
ncbi:hypothetical protein ACFL0J_08375 [Candidatus Neomarinimicrobiota bacterium]